MHLNEYNSVYNTFIVRCSNHKCRKIHFLKEYTIFGRFPKAMASTILFIIKLWIFESKNVDEIYSKILNDYSNFPLRNQKIFEIISYMRNIFAYYLKDIYKIEDMSTPNEMANFAVDESLFINYHNMQYWVIGIINVATRVIRLEISPIRDTNVLKDIIKTHIKSGNISISDNWPGYHWLSNPASGYYHHVHTHSHGDFGSGTDSNSHIEQLWAHLKSIIKNLYHIHRKFCIIFERE